MAEKENEEIEIKKTSQFCYKENSRLEFDRTHEKSRANISTLIEKGIIKSSDKSILDFLSQYTYLNAYLIRCLYTGNEDGGTVSDTKAMRKKLKALLKTGLISRFRIVYVDSFCVEHSSPFIYQLGSTASLLLSEEDRQKRGIVIPTVEGVMRRLAFNQFMITVTLQYMYKRIYLTSGYDSLYNDGQVVITVKENRIAFNVLCIRSDKNWKNLFKDKVTKKKNEFPYIVVCESEKAALDIDYYKRHSPGMSGVGTFYVCDYACISGEPVFDQILCVSSADCSSYDIYKFDVS